MYIILIGETHINQIFIIMSTIFLAISKKIVINKVKMKTYNVNLSSFSPSRISSQSLKTTCRSIIYMVKELYQLNIISYRLKVNVNEAPDDWIGKVCESHNDPHMKTFDGR